VPRQMRTLDVTSTKLYPLVTKAASVFDRPRLDNTIFRDAREARTASSGLDDVSHRAGLREWIQSVLMQADVDRQMSTKASHTFFDSKTNNQATAPHWLRWGSDSKRSG
jgi:hypothetical protein